MGLVAITLEGRSLRLAPLIDGSIDLRAEEGPPGPLSVFERLDVSHGRIALRIPDGRFLARHVEHPGNPIDQGAVVTLADELTQCAAFEEVHLPGGYISLRACDLRFLGVHTSGRVVAGRVSNGTWERFRYLDIPAPLAVATTEPELLSVAAPTEYGALRAVAPMASDPPQRRSTGGGSGPVGQPGHSAFLAAV